MRFQQSRYFDFLSYQASDFILYEEGLQNI